MTYKYIIIDPESYKQLVNKEFENFDRAEDYLKTRLQKDYATKRCEYEITIVEAKDAGPENNKR